jgi:hypothetical protein
MGFWAENGFRVWRIGLFENIQELVIFINEVDLQK